MNRQKRLMRILECLHPVFLLSLIAPGLHLFYTTRTDTVLPALYMAGFLLLICSGATHFAARNAVSLPGYLLISAAGAVLTLIPAWVLGRHLFMPSVQSFFMVEMAAGCLWLTSISARVRMREKQRQKALKENDTAWRDSSIPLGAPSPAGFLCFPALYLLSLFTSCPIFCDMMLVWGTIYLLMFLIYRHLEVTEDFLTLTKNVGNVPVKKLQRLRLLRLAGFLLPLLTAGVICLAAGSHRHYRDLRYMSFHHVIHPEALHLPSEDLPMPEPLPDYMAGYVPSGKPLILFRYLEKILPVLAFLIIVLLAVRAVMEYHAAFRHPPEENGDIAVPLDPEEADSLIPALRPPRFGSLSERERIRKKYRQTIRRYRKRASLPAPCETPSQIEAGTVFPEGFDIQSLHEAYEKARYSQE